MLAALLVVLSLVAPRPAGAADPHVTQANVRQTICQPGYTATVRPPVTFTAPIKAKLVGYGYLSDYQLDHLIPLELGGAPRDLRNLWVEPIAEAHRKDHEENRLHREVCASRMTLRTAQRRIVRYH